MSKEDSFIFDMIDGELSNFDLDTLYKIRRKFEANNYDTEVIDKIIVSKEKEEKLSKSDDFDELMPWEREEVDSGNYEPFNFEEEDLEDDDYYNDDLD